MITIIKTSEYNVKLKATIHSSGRLGFTADTADKLNLSGEVYVKFAKDDDLENELFMVLVQNEDEDSFKVVKSGKYYYLPTTAMFQSFGYDFKKYNIIFDLVRMSDYDNFVNGKVYKLNKRVLMRKAKQS
ncbi:MAG: hypothetical protein ACI304_00055 [Lepagella sp.]